MEPQIGIVTALEHEYIAMKVLLEEGREVSVPGQGAGRRYYHGYIKARNGRHSVVLTLADKGNNIASRRATLLLEHFKSVESIIMVGIACGIPDPTSPESHVRLGDIVVSDKSGVLQYDMIKDTDGLVEVRSTWVPPHPVLLEGVKLMEAERLLKQFPWEKHIQLAVQNLEWKRPPSSRDQIFSAPPSPTKLRHPRDPSRRKGHPRVFLGRIAAANILLKNAERRDRLKKEHSIKAVEMEASGIADATWEHGKGYLIIRSICDYGDSHKNDKWQKYAAIAAAAYTKALLESMPMLSVQTTVVPIAHLTPQHGSIDEALRLFVAKEYAEDQYARLDQAGEADPDRSTLLKQVFVDLDVKSSAGQDRILARMSAEDLNRNVSARLLQEKPFPALEFLLQEQYPLIALIGGPGHGKSTLGQYLAQIHRSILLEHDTTERLEKAREPRKKRLPFRIVLKNYAYWLSDKKANTTLEAYLVDQILRGSSYTELSSLDVQSAIQKKPTLIILDGLDEVTEPLVRSRVLANVEGFLARLYELKADLQVLATSRPTDYNGEFDPSKFWHIELQPMSSVRVNEYSQRWVSAKVPNQHERERVVDTLKDCLTEEHTKLLLTTPLQVTIVLLVIKGGGRPPSLREALFQEYWNTILRREKAKAKGVIRSDDQTLFELHAYFGFTLQARAAIKELNSLLPEAAFLQAVGRFIKARDTVSSEQAVIERAEQVVSDARSRLVMLVEPEPGLFGFELRSIQEFFAAVYLTQTASDTNQRFRRIKVIARSAHWRNVILFCAGRVVRTFGGEAANLLELVCRAIDRNPEDKFLKRGARLALDIAADGAFAANRDLQFSAIEYGLSVLEIAASIHDQQLVNGHLRRISAEDRRDILEPLSCQRFKRLPLPLVSAMLPIFAHIFTDQAFVKSQCERLLSSTRSEERAIGVDVAISNSLDPSWTAGMLLKNIDLLEHCVPTIYFCWFANPDYVLSVLRYLPNKTLLLEKIARATPQWQREPIMKLDRKYAKPSAGMPDQVIAIFHLARLSYIIALKGVRRSSIRTPAGIISCYEPSKTGRGENTLCPRAELQATIDDPGLCPVVRVFAWKLLVWNYALGGEERLMLFEQLLAIRSLAPDLVDGLLELHWERRPLIWLATSQIASGRVAQARNSFLAIGEQSEAEVARSIRQAIQTHVGKLTGDALQDFLIALQLDQAGNVARIDEIAQRIGVPTSELLAGHVDGPRGLATPYSHNEVRCILAHFERSLRRDKSRVPNIMTIAMRPWAHDEDITFEVGRLFEKACTATREDPKFSEITFLLFLQLLRMEPSRTVEHASRVCGLLLELEDKFEIDPWVFSELVVNLRKVHLMPLRALLESSDPHLKAGGLYLWDILLGAALSAVEYLDSEAFKEFETLRVPSSLAVGLLRSEDEETRLRGIRLLFSSDALDEGTSIITELLVAMAAADGPEETYFWARFLSSINPQDNAALMELLTAILERPHDFPARISAGAMGRLQAITVDDNEGVLRELGRLGVPNMN